MTDLVYPLLGISLITMLLLEAQFPMVRAALDLSWLGRAIIINVAQLGMALLAALTVNEWLAPHALMHLQHHVATPLAGLLAFALGNFVQYWWHRLQHKSDFLWRWLHQLHHSPRNIDVLVSNYAHPVDFFIIITFYAIAALLVFGLDTTGVAWATLFSGLYNYYIHCNLRSPRWLGVVVQRPEMHRVHHRIGHHAQNYGLPLWDMMFGTWHNPDSIEFECGFGDGKERRVLAMLSGRDLNA